MSILELAALAGARLRARSGSNGNGHSPANSAPAQSADGRPIDPDLLKVELAYETFRANGSKPEDFLMEGAE